MKRLPYIDQHAITVAADRATAWTALLRVMCRNPDDPSTVPPGFVLDRAKPHEEYALNGRHPFAVYRLVFELDEEGSQRTRVRALTWAEFPGIRGKIYRTLVITSGAHRIVVRRMLKRVAAEARPHGAPVP
jgi:hypothetical protein